MNVVTWLRLTRLAPGRSTGFTCVLLESLKSKLPALSAMSVVAERCGTL